MTVQNITKIKGILRAGLGVLLRVLEKNFSINDKDLYSAAYMRDSYAEHEYRKHKKHKG